MGEEVVWVPTACMALLETLHVARPNHTVIAADFDMLPDVQIAGKNAPLVSEKVGCWGSGGEGGRHRQELVSKVPGWQRTACCCVCVCVHALCLSKAVM